MKVRASGGNGDEPKTLLSRFGFQDGDLKSPVHDEMMLWLDEHADELVTKVFGAQTPSRASVQDKAVADAMTVAQRRGWGGDRERFEGQLAVMPTEVQASMVSLWTLVGKTWEKPVQDERGYTLGFVDMEIIAERPGPGCVVDVYGKAGWEVTTLRLRVAVEVKTAIPSMGELLRQIRLYESWWPKYRFVVVCPDDRFADAIERQGIRFVKYAP